MIPFLRMVINFHVEVLNIGFIGMTSKMKKNIELYYQD